MLQCVQAGTGEQIQPVALGETASIGRDSSSALVCRPPVPTIARACEWKLIWSTAGAWVGWNFEEALQNRAI
eukprot:2677644-Rhodomonas_salina.5